MVNTPERNPGGAVQLFDGGVPRTITVKARAHISGGYWVAGSSGYASVGSLASDFASADIEGFPTDSIVNQNVIGVAMQTILSGTYGQVAQRGVFIMPAASGTSVVSIRAGYPIAAGSGGTVLELGSTAAAGGMSATATTGGEYLAGRALSTGSGTNSDNVNDFVVVSVNV